MSYTCTYMYTMATLTLYISVCRLRVWSFSQLTRMIIAQSQHSDGQSTQINFIQSSSPLHDLLTTPTSTTVNAISNKSRSFQVCACMQYSKHKDPLPALLVKLIAIPSYAYCIATIDHKIFILKHLWLIMFIVYIYWFLLWFALMKMS